MDDRRFDSLVKALATGTSRRSVFKGLLGLGGVTAIGGSLLQDGADAARRPTPTPKAPSCPGQQFLQSGQCTCPASAPSKCGPDCCNPAGVDSAHSECCDNACCFGLCYGEELCCPWPRSFCPEVQECCDEGVTLCCGEAGCCAGGCCQDAQGNDLCCSGATPRCCPGDTCIADDVDSCCDASDCGPGDCWSCIDHRCVSDQAKCASGCVDCVQGTCQTVDANCDDGDPCTVSTCNADGTCTPTVRDCRIDGCGCVARDVCHPATCDQNSGECSEEYDCAPAGCCTPSDMCFQSVCDVNVCRETLFCSNDELSQEEGDSCCNSYGNPDPDCLVSGTCNPSSDPPSTVVQVGECQFSVICGEVCCERYQSDFTFCACVDL